MDYKEAIAYINDTQWFASPAVMERMEELLGKLGEPQKKLKFIHVAGTNGKGSCAAMLASVLKAAGYKTGLFTSPYLFRYNERMQINGKQIEDDALAEIVGKVKDIAEKMDDHPTAFDLTTAAGLYWFAQEKCDIVVLEVGLGGRLDSTNVIPCPELAVIMNIGLDHTDRLGDTLEKIAAEKAGIIKPGGEVVLYSQTDEVTKVIETRCRELGAKLHSPDFSEIKPEFDSILGQSFTYKGNTYALPLLGKAQLRNAATVLEAVDVLRSRGWKLSHGDVEHGIYSVSWPGRFELLSEEPCFVVDGGHNPQCAQTVAENLRQYFPGCRRVLLLGVLEDKDYRGLVDILAPEADEFVCITPPSARALPAEKLAQELSRFGKNVTVCEDIRAGVETARERAGEDGMVCAVGSLYSVGEIRACFELY